MLCRRPSHGKGRGFGVPGNEMPLRGRQSLWIAFKIQPGCLAVNENSFAAGVLPTILPGRASSKSPKHLQGGPCDSGSDGSEPRPLLLFKIVN